MAGLESLGLDSLVGGLGVANLWTYFGYVMWMVAIAVAGWFIYNMIIYKYHVVIIERRGDKDQVISEDAARKWKDKNGVEKYWLKKEKIALDYQDFKFHHHVKGKMFKKQALVYYKFGESSYTPMTLMNSLAANSVKLVPLEADRAKMVQLGMELEEKFDTRNFWEKYGQLVIGFMMFAVLLVMLIFVGRTMENVSANLGGSIETVVTACQQLNECLVK